ncbi:MAG TPA: hypothetical protein DGP89_07155 [Saprospirales bacterium]|nr:hypothetical protein [Saprospirales bacterium]
MENKTNGLSIGGMVVGILSLLISFIPCIGVLGGLIGVVGLILSIIGYRSAKDSGGPTTIAIVGIVLSALAIIIALAWGTFMSRASNNATTPLEIETCEEVLAEMKKTTSEMKVLQDKGDDAGFGDLSLIINSTTKLISIQKAAEEMSCNNDPEFKAKMDEFAKEIED